MLYLVVFVLCFVCLLCFIALLQGGDDGEDV